jgi:hypothetical protein
LLVTLYQLLSLSTYGSLQTMKFSDTLLKYLLEIEMIQMLRIKLARWILGKHCPCYQMGYHNMVDFQQRSADQLAKSQQRSQL